MKLGTLRLGKGTWALLALSILPFLFPGTRWVSVLTGENRLDAELRQAQTRGYYENLVSEPISNNNARTENGPEPEREPPAPPGWLPFAESGIVEPVDGFLRWRMKPNLRTEWNGTRFSTNRFGYRTPDVAIPKPGGTYRIVVLGSSNTMGHGVNDEELFVRLFEDWLNSEEAGTNRHVEVVNLAVSSDSPSQNLVRLQSDVPELEPDWILNDVTVLDYSLEELHLHTIVRGRRTIPFAYIRSILLDAGVSSSDTFAEFSAKLRGSTEAMLDGAYRGRVDAAADLGCPMTLIHLPRTDAKIENRNLKRIAVRLAARHSLPMIDLTDAYRGRDLSEYRLSPWDKHPSVLGHRLIFEALRDALIERGGAPGLELDIEAKRTEKLRPSRVSPA